MTLRLPHVLCSVFVALCVSTTAEALVVDSYPEAIAMAERDNVPLVLDFYTDWCAPCKKFDKDLEKNDPMRATVARLILCKINAEQEDGIELAKAHAIKVYPTFILVGPDGEQLVRWGGYTEAEKWVGLVEGFLNDPTRFEDRLARYQEEPTADLGRSVAFILLSNGDYRQALPIYRDLIELDPDEAASYKWLVFRCMAETYADRKFSVTEVRAAADAAQESSLTLERRFMLASYMKKVARIEGDMRLYGDYVDPVLEQCAKAEDAYDKARCNDLQLDRILYVERDEHKAIEARRAELPDGWEQDPRVLAGYAMWCYENRVDLVACRGLLRDGLANGIEPQGFGQAVLLSTLADVCRAQGDIEGAIEAVEQAIQLQPQVQDLRDTLAVYQQALQR
jgi:thioredoxin-like negative regulator of GroEL